MGLETQTEKIRTKGRDKQPIEIEYRCTPLPGWRGYLLFVKLARIAAPSIGRVVNGAKSLKDMMRGDIDVDVDFAEVFSLLAERLDEPVVQGAVEQLMEGLIRMGHDSRGNVVKQELADRNVFNEVFAANYKELMAAIWFAAKVNFSDFFDGETLGRVLEKEIKKDQAATSLAE
jgi:hypothetical protein